MVQGSEEEEERSDTHVPDTGVFQISADGSTPAYRTLGIVSIAESYLLGQGLSHPSFWAECLEWMRCRIMSLKSRKIHA